VTGDGRPDLLVHDRDEYVTAGPSTDGLGRTVAGPCTGEGFDSDGGSWSLPDYGPGINSGGWFEEGFDRYSDGLNWSLAGLSHHEMGNLAIYLRDEYVTEGPQVAGLGRDTWQVHVTRCESWCLGGSQAKPPHLGSEWTHLENHCRTCIRTSIVASRFEMRGQAWFMFLVLTAVGCRTGSGSPTSPVSAGEADARVETLEQRVAELQAKLDAEAAAQPEVQPAVR